MGIDSNTFKTLIFSAVYPIPENIGTRMRTMNFVRFFKKIGEVDLVYFNPDYEDQVEKGPFRNEYKIDIKSYVNENSLMSSYRAFRGRITRLVERRPWIVKEWSKAAVEQLNIVVKNEEYDFIVCRYTHESYPFLRYQVPILKKMIIDFDDVLSSSLFDEYVKRLPGFYRGMKWNLQKNFLLNYQKRFFSFGAVLFCSNEDREDVTEGKLLSNTYILPNTYPITTPIMEAESNGYNNRRTLLFVGSLNYDPNIVGLKWFLESIYPRVKERYKDAKLLIVGRRPPRALVTLCHGYPDVEVHADVSNVGPMYERCGAVVVPLLSGGGTRIKILEAAMARRPVFSTPIGAHGLLLKDDLHLFLFNDEGSFLEQFKKLDDEVIYRNCVENLHAVVGKYYSHNAFDRAMNEVIMNLIGGTKG